ncbi:Fatty acyl-CoA reductase [Streptomyces lavendulae subsp. lavendulae]|uniref:Fatty acyl-CoA reductase n=1 Tax=Streptomyces lavendulae subsp. lavendulae TaxID=58340 RepID=A0A2K8PSE7_STRLA|nr:Fatty acyl-CoA reductase [Streptomyces lavendulae subsp. lavendulae]QUQ58851.1 hypothetical protein SLLC_34500 [Streptomyces lavendulae subsp. lavendulae]
MTRTGRTVVVTGASSGLGAVTARELARAGAHVVLAVRDTARGERLAATLTGSVEVRPLDLADLSSVRAFAAGWDRPLDVLVNNAGVMAIPEARTADGFEMQLGTNHLGPFALTNLLLPYLTDRVVTVASNAHRGPGVDIDFDDINSQRAYRPRRPRRAARSPRPRPAQPPRRGRPEGLQAVGPLRTAHRGPLPACMNIS